MSLFVYITEECIKDASSHSIVKDLEDFKQRILKSQRTTFFDNFPPPYLKKRFRRQERLIAAERRIQDHIVVCFYRILIRGGREYSNFLSSPKEFGDQFLMPLVTQERLNEWIKAQLSEIKTPDKPDITEEENRFIWGVLGTEEFFSGEVFIYESHDWIRSIENKEIINRLILIPKRIIRIIDNNNKSEKTSEEIGEYIIRYKFLKESRILFLIGIVKKSGEEQLISKYTEILNAENESDSINQIKRLSGKCYPAIILADEDNWINIQTNKDFNLALSPEETELLKSVIKNDKDVEENFGFPLFINGRAGSGKSTILQYLFSDYLRFYAEQNFQELNTPLFITYSKDLVDKCQRVLNGLLKFNYKNYNSNTLSVSLNDIILDFHTFLINKLPSEIKELNFKPTNFIDFSKFSQLWYMKFSKDSLAYKNYGPDISWHVIRSYIKGLSLDGFLDLEEYEELPRDERNVTKGTFKVIYEKVWSNWYKPLCEGNDKKEMLWDSQDLVRYLLDKNLITPKASAIFCDEAQDFTRIELELLFRLSIFSERKINSSSLKRIPFAFAGDPFQTLNPTGFRWESIKASFVNKFILSLNPENRFGNPELNYHELSFNYRSSSNIVKLCNSIQLLRLVLFEHQHILPQDSWMIEALPPMPVFFDSADIKVKEKLSTQLDLLIIVPCKEGEEIEFVREDEFLRDVIECDEKGVPQNVLSPIRAKGLEFPRVVLYGFGKYTPGEFDFRENSIDTIVKLETDLKIPLEYYINQLYVGASRAQKRLFIIDSYEGYINFWRFAADTGFQEDLLSKCHNPKNWENEIGGINHGSEISWTEDREDTEKIATQIEEEGILKKDPYLLRQAAMTYKSIDKKDKAYRCRAVALYFEEDYNKAGEQYIKCSDFDKALECFWLSQRYDQIVLLIEKDTRFATRLESRVSNGIENKISLKNLNGILSDVAIAFKENQESNQIIINKDTWIKAIDLIISKNLVDAIHANNSEMKDLGTLILKIKEYIDIKPKLIADILFYGQNFEKASEFYLKAGLTTSDNYRISKLNVLYKEIETNPGNLSSDDYRLLADDQKEKQAYLHATAFYLKIPDHKGILDCLEKSAKNLKVVNPEAFNNYINALVLQNELEKMISIFSNNFSVQPLLNQFILENQRDILTTITLELATSILLVNSEIKIKDKVSDFLYDKFVKPDIKVWRRYLTPELVGAALERAGRDKDCLRFYEKIMDDYDFSEEIKRRANIRWIVVKFNQARREELNDYTQKASMHRNEANKSVERLGIEDFNEPEFPNISEYKTLKPKIRNIDPKQTQHEIGKENTYEPEIENFQNLLLKINRRFKRINLEDKYDSSAATFFFDAKEPFSYDFKIYKQGRKFYIKEWNLEVDYNSNEITFFNTVTKNRINISY